MAVAGGALRRVTVEAPGAPPLGGEYLGTGAGFFFGQQSFTLGTLPPGRFRGYAGEFYGEVGLSHDLELNTSLRIVDNPNLFDRPLAGYTGTENLGGQGLEPGLAVLRQAFECRSGRAVLAAGAAPAAAVRPRRRR